MLEFLYTGATKFEAEQKLASKSLGGFISSSLIPNEEFGNLFADISSYTIWNTKGKEYRVIALHNSGNTTLTGLKLWYELEGLDDSEPSNDSFCECRLAYAVPSIDNCANLYTEQLPTVYSKPMSVTLTNAFGQGNALNLPDMQSDDYLVIFIERLLTDFAKRTISTDELKAIAEGTEVLPTIENIYLKVFYN